MSLSTVGLLLQGINVIFGVRLVSGLAPEMIGAFIISKLMAGIISIVLAVWLYERESKEFSLKENGGISYEYQR